MKKSLFIVFIVSCMLFCFALTACSETIAATNSTDFSDIVDFISKSYSQRQFTDRPISDEIIHKILVAGHQAGSARNAQPWHFTVVRNRDFINEIMNNVTDENVLIVVSAPQEEPGSRFSMNFDAGLASQNIFLAAQALGLGARMYIMPVQNLNENLLPRLQLPDENLRVKIIIRLGYEEEGVDATTAASARQPIETKINFIN